MDDLEALRLQLKEQEELIAPEENEVKRLANEKDRLYKEYLNNIRIANMERRQREEDIFEKRRSMNELRNKIRLAEQEAQRKAEEQAAIMRLEQEANAKRGIFDRVDKLTANKPWVEDAMPHQIAAGKYIMENRNVILADEMGLGKTLSSIITSDMSQAITSMTNPSFPFLGEEIDSYVGRRPDGTPKYEKKIVNAITRPVGKKVMYFCPKPLINNVEKEFRIWCGDNRNVIFIKEMTKKEKDFIFNFMLKGQDQFVVICNYDAWRKDLNLIDRLIELKPDTIILDEAHNIKDMKSIAYKGIEQLVFGARPEYVIPMTGTPVLNRPQELFTLLHLVNPNEFALLSDYLYTYCEQDNDNFWHFKPGGLDRLAKRIRKNFLRRTKKDAGIKLPPQTIIKHEIELDKERYPEQARVRKEMAEFATIMIDKVEKKAVSAAAIIAMFTRLRQIETWPAGIIQHIKDEQGEIIESIQVDVHESQKIDYVISANKDEFGNYTGLIPEFIENERGVLFSQFVMPLEVIKERVENAGYKAVILNGATSKQLRDAIEQDFNARTAPDIPRWDIVLCNYRVGGAGLNFTAASQTIILDEEWNPGKRDQAYGRTDRIGQESPTTVHVVRNMGTIDDWMSGLMEAKEELVDGFNQSMDVQDFSDFTRFMKDKDIL